MATWETVCEIARALPGAQLDADGDNPAWRVRGKVILRRNPRLDEPEPDGEVIAVRCDRDEQQALVAEDPATFFLTEHWARSRNPSILVRLAGVDEVQLRELVTDAWRARA